MQQAQKPVDDFAPDDFVEDDFQPDEPSKKSVLKPFAADLAKQAENFWGTRVLKGVTDAVKNTVNTIPSAYHAITEPPNPEDPTEGVIHALHGQAGLAVHRMFVHPQVQEAIKAASDETSPTYSEKFGHALAAITPFVGPLAAHIGERAGKGEIPEAAGEGLGYMALGEVTPKILGKITDLTKSKPIDLTPNRNQINSLSQIVRAGVRSNVSPQEVAIPTQGFLRQAFQELGIKPEDLTTKETAPQTDLYGDLYRGLKPVEHATLAKNLGKTSSTTKPIAIEAADRAVDIAHRPIQSAVENYKSEPIPSEVKQSIIDSLEAEAAQYSKENAPMESALRKRIEEVRNANNFGDLNNIKVNANKKTSTLFGKSPSAQVAATANTVYAHQLQANAIREFMYPALETVADIPEGSLIQAGRLESAMIQARDGIYSNWANAAGDQATRSLKSYITHVVKGEDAFLPISVKSAAAGMARRAIGFKHPLAEFNQALKNGVGPIDMTKFNTGRLGLAGPEEMSATAIVHEGPTDGPYSMRAPIKGQLGTGQRMISDRTDVLTPPPPAESFAEALKREQSPQTKLMREFVNKEGSSGPYNTPNQPPMTLDEYIQTKGGRRMFNSDRYRRERSYKIGDQQVYEYSDSEGRRFISSQPIPNTRR